MPLTNFIMPRDVFEKMQKESFQRSLTNEKEPTDDGLTDDEKFAKMKLDLKYLQCCHIDELENNYRGLTIKHNRLRHKYICLDSKYRRLEDQCKCDRLGLIK
jgi:hypothetical protein